MNKAATAENRAVFGNPENGGGGNNDSQGNNNAANKEPVTTADEQSILGRWKTVEFNIKDMSEEEKKGMTENVVLEFTAEGNFNAYNKEQKQEGTYTYKDNKLELLNKSSTKTDRFTIGWEDGTMLMINEEGTVKLVRQ